MADREVFQLTTPLPAGTLRLRAFGGREEVSQLFGYRLIALAKPGGSVDLDALLGKAVELAIVPLKGEKRIFNGLVSQAAFEGVIGRFPAYRLELVPWLWFATRSADVRIFQGKSVPDILKTIFDKYGGAVSFELSGQHPQRAFCVQYRESDFDFASRLMEEEGIFYFFRHAAGKHTLVLGDQPAAHKPLFGLDSLPYREDWDARAAEPAVTAWRWRREVQTGKLTLRDHHFLRPASNFESSASASRSHPFAKTEVYDYPAGLSNFADDGQVGNWDGESATQSKMRLDERQSRFALASGETGSVHLATGARFKLSGHALAEQNVEHVVLSTDIQLEAPDAEALAGGAGAVYKASFDAVPASVTWRPARRTRKPLVAGPQTATVVGPSGEEIFVDKHGRVKVQFHWDREGKRDAASSCFVRVAQPSAGKGFGFVSIPRIGQEVVVDFLEGDPDQPIVVGSVYNADNVPPYALPDQMTVTSFKSRSLKGGAADYSELRFDDAQGKEYLMLRAQKDRYDVVQNDLRSEIGANEERTVGKNQSLSIGENVDLTIGKNASQTVGDTMMLDVGKDLQVNAGQNVGLTAGQDAAVDAGMNWSLNAGQEIHVKAGTNVGTEAGMNLHLKAGMNVVIEGGMQLTIKAGAGSVVLGPDGVSITGPLVKVNSGGAAGSGAGAQPKKPTKPQQAKKPEKLKDPLDGKHR